MQPVPWPMQGNIQNGADAARVGEITLQGPSAGTACGQEADRSPSGEVATQGETESGGREVRGSSFRRLIIAGRTAEPVFLCRRCKSIFQLRPPRGGAHPESVGAPASGPARTGCGPGHERAGPEVGAPTSSDGTVPVPPPHSRLAAAGTFAHFDAAWMNDRSPP